MSNQNIPRNQALPSILHRYNDMKSKCVNYTMHCLVVTMTKTYVQSHFRAPYRKIFSVIKTTNYEQLILNV